MTNNNVFLAKLVTFDFHSVLFKINELENCIDTEEYRLVAVYGSRAYDLQSSNNYKVISRVNGTIASEELSEIRPNVQYVYDLLPLIDCWDMIKEVYKIEQTYDEFVNVYKEDIEKLNAILSSDNKIIDFNEVKMLINRRKF